MQRQHFAQTPGTSGWAYGLWEDTRDGHRALLHNGGGKGYRALMYLLPERDAGFFVAYNLADQHQDGELQEVFITEFRKRFVPARQSTEVQSDDHALGERVVGDYQYVRRARTTAESFISVVNRVRIAAREDGGLTVSGLSGRPIALTRIGPLVFRRDDEHGAVAFEPATEAHAQRVVVIADSGFPAVYERVALIASLRVQVSWLSMMVLVFLYAIARRPLRGGWRQTRVKGRDATGRFLSAGIASALNLVFLIGFPPTFLGRIEGGVPDFVYGVPVAARLLLLIPVVTAFMGVAVSIAVIASWRKGRTAAVAGDVVVAIALLSFVVFAWYWNLLPLQDL
jgi:hypothetical protein